MPPPLTFEYNPLSYAYPDDESDKPLFLQASGTHASHLRTVFLYWVNTVFSDGEEVWQLVRLCQREDARDTYKYVYPDMIVVDECEREHNATCDLGVFSRDQREAVLECAEDIGYDPRPRPGEEDEGTRWMSELLKRMVDEGLVARTVVDAIREDVPIPRPNTATNHDGDGDG